MKINQKINKAPKEILKKVKTTKNKKVLKSPVTYYWGKLRMASRIVKLIPKHTLYCEPYCWWCSVFFKKPPSEIEVLNDINSHVVNFFRVMQQDFGMLKIIINCTPYSRQQVHTARHILKYHEYYDDIKRARAFWVACNMSFSAMITGGYKYTKHTNKSVKAFNNKKEQFDTHLLERLTNVDFECNDAIKVIKSRDHEDAFFYIDPPYIWEQKVHQWHYAGFTPEDYIVLLDTLSNIKGKFLLSNYPSTILSSYANRNGWYIIEIAWKQTAPNSSVTGKRKNKTELLVANYPITL